MQLRSIALGGIVGALLAGSVGVGVAATTTASTTTYYACLSSQGGLSKVGTTSPTCTPPARVISWNARGPQGIPGIPGAPGAPGPSASYFTHPFGTSTLPTFPTFLTVAALNLPAGSYVLSGIVQIANHTADDIVTCQGAFGGSPVADFNQSFGGVVGFGIQQVAVNFAGTLPAAGRATVDCFSGLGTSQVTEAMLTATMTGSLAVQ